MLREIGITFVALLVGSVIGISLTQESRPMVKPGTITKVYEKGFEDGSVYVSGYWYGELQHCAVKEGY